MGVGVSALNLRKPTRGPNMSTLFGQCQHQTPDTRQSTERAKVKVKAGGGRENVKIGGLTWMSILLTVRFFCVCAGDAWKEEAMSDER